MNISEFAQKIRSKYPGSYDHVDDETLSKKIIEKYPQYADKVEFGQQPDTMLNRVADTLRPVGEAIGKVSEMGMKTLPPFSPQKLGFQGAALLQMPFDVAGEKLTEKMGGSGIPGVSNPYVAAGAGTLVQNIPTIGQSILMGMSPKEPVQPSNIFQRYGAKGINEQVGIKPSTIDYMSGSQNPAEVGTNLAKSLFKEGSIGSTPGETFTKASNVKSMFGKQVGSSIEKLKQQGSQTTVPAEEALSPLFEKMKSFEESTYSSDRALAVPFREAYDKLWSTIEDGKISFDSVRKVMQETGKALERAGEDTPKEAAYSELYGSLAQVKDSIIKRLAESSGNQKLAEDLMSANKGYTRYNRIMPDIRRAAAKSTVGSKGFHPWDYAKNAATPILSKGSMAIGNALEAVESNTPSIKSTLPIATKQLTEEIARKYWKQAKSEGLKKASEIRKRTEELLREAGYNGISRFFYRSENEFS